MFSFTVHLTLLVLFSLYLISKITLMRRPTITPSGRNSTKPRVSLSMSNTSIRREIRNVRDKDHLYTCTSTLENFLIKHDYPFTPKTLTNPSAKDVASLFKLIFSMYDSSWEYSLRFEEDVILILKGLKYPYMCEINRSQFIAITPHSWPVILSMLAWLVELVSIEVSIDSQSFISLFNKHLISGYSGCMQGIDSFDEEGFEIDVKTQYKDVFSDINKKLEVYQEIEDKTEKIRMEMKSGSIKAKKESLVKRRDEIKSDLENLKMRSKQLAEKKKKYENITNELIEQNESLEKENNLYALEIEKLKKLVDEQQIKPEDIDDMTKDKNEMYSEMERLRPVKEQTIRELSENEKIQNDTMDMLEKMLFDLKNISDGVSLYKTYKERNDYKIEFIGDNNEKEIDELSFNLRNAIDNLTEKVLHLESRKAENEETKKSIFDELKQIESIVLAKGKFYIEKKAMCGVEHKKMSGELGMLENEILKMNMESQHAVLIAEKKYQEKQIEYDRYRNTKQMESEMLAEAVEKLRNVLINVHASLEMSYKEF